MASPSGTSWGGTAGGAPSNGHNLAPLLIQTHGSNTPDTGSQPMSPASSSNPMSPTLMSPGTMADAGRNVAVDYMKSRYESVDKRQDVKKLPEIVRQPKKLDGEWDKMLDQKTKRQEESAKDTIKEQDILAMVFACAGIDTKSQYMTLMAEKEASFTDIPANRQPVEKVAPPEITKTVRNMFESGNMAELHNPQKRLQTYEMTPGSGVFENEPVRPEGVIRSGEQRAEDEAAVQRGLTKSLLSQWQNMGGSEVKKDDVLDGDQILKGTTKSLLSQWSTKASTDSAAPSTDLRKMIKIHATDGTVSESRPVKRTDVVRAEDLPDDESEKIQTGMTKNLLSQWKSKGTEEFKSERREAINIADGEGKVVENVPTRRNDVIRENDITEADGEAVCSGQTKSVLSQWKTKGSEQFKIERKPIKIAEDEGVVAENEPTRCIDVVNAVDSQTSDDSMIEKGFTKSLVSQWKTKDSGEFVSARKVINIAEDDGKILESVPIPRTDVAREEDIPPEKCVQQGITKNLLGHFKAVGAQEFKKDRSPIVISAGEGSVAENEPEVRSDVMREYDVREGDEVKQGFTKSLLNQWKTKGSEEFRSERKPINIADGEGKVAENEPTQRLDVARENYNEEVAITEQIKQNSTKTLRSQWLEKGREEFRKSKSPIVLAEAEGTIAENDPIVRTDVVREYDVAGEQQVQRGTTKLMRDKWANKASEEFSRERTPIVLPEGEAIVSENMPEVRSDVVRENYDVGGERNQIQQGITRTLKSKYINKSSEEYKKDRTPILLAEGEGVVSENQPTVRTDVVREYDDSAAGEETQVQRGITKNLLNQWKSKGTEEFKTERKAIIIAKDEGNVSENDPIRRTDVIREDDSVTEGELIQKGLTKNLMSQWKAKGSEKFQIERPPINVAEGDDGIHENEPTRRSDVVREDASYGEENIQKGFTKHLTSQWKTKGTEEFRLQKSPINVAEAEGSVSENEPIKRTDVIRADDSGLEENIQRGFTKNLTSQWKSKGTESFQIQRAPINITEGEGVVSENDPIQRSDVVREDVSYGEETIQRGLTKNLTSQWKSKGSEGFKIQRAPINIAEGQGVVSENEPTQRSDVVREDASYGEETIQKGLTKNLTNQWKFKGSEGFQSQRAPINIAEGQGIVSENEPTQRSDVVREDASYGEETIQKGFTKNLTSQWKSKGSEGFQIQRAPINIAEGQGVVSENEPTQRTDVVREEASYGEEFIQKGLTKNLTSQWKSKGSEGFSIQRAPINIAEGQGVVSENEPTQRSDVVREDASYGEESIQKGLTKNLTSQWKSKGSEGFQIQRAPINIAEGQGVVSENEPTQRSDVVREDASYGEETIQRGLTKNLTSQWKTKGSEEFRIERVPINIAEGEGTVSENEPMKRSDVVREDASYGEDSIQRGFTKTLTSKWIAKGSEEFQIERKPINIADGEGSVSENVPTRRDDVFREDASYGEENIQPGLARNIASQWSCGGPEGCHTPINILEGEGTVSENTPTQRDDVYRENEVRTKIVIQTGTTKTLLGQWKTKGNEEFRIERSPINILEGEGGVSENVPTPRDDVVREDVSYGEENIQKGLTKNLTSQWKAKGTETFRLERAPINVLEGEGKVSENQPTQRTDVVREDASYGEEKIERGLAKNLANQWKAKGTETFNLERAPINILEGEGKVSENEPTQRTDVVRENASYGEEKIEHGLAKNLANQWKAKGMETFNLERAPINILEGEGKVSENEPMQRTDVVREDASYGEEKIERGLAKNLTNQWKAKGTETFNLERAPINILEGEGKISENEPTQRTDVVREDASYGEEKIERGLAKNLANQWKARGTETFNLERAPINILEGEGKVSENEPTQRTDVIREDASYGEEKIERGLAKSLANQWKAKGSETFNLERAPINILEGEGKVSENEPTRRTDVVREDASYGEERIERGLAKNLANQWKTKGSETFNLERAPINILEGEGKVSENNPTQRTDVVRENASYGEENIERGLAKSLANQWKAKGTETFNLERAPINILEGEGKVSENEPTQRTDVVREDASYGEEKIERGLAKNLANQWKAKGAETFNLERAPINILEGEGKISENEPTQRTDVVREDASYGEEKIECGLAKHLANQWKAKGAEEFRIERSPINIAEGEGTVSENEPIRRSDVIRADDYNSEESIQRGITKNLTSQWKSKGTEEFRLDRPPVNLAEGEGSISENQPTSRTDVVRESSEYGEEIIRKGLTKNLTSQWKTKGSEEYRIERSPINILEGEGKVAENEPTQRTDVVREDASYGEESIQRGLTKNLKSQWTNKGSEEFKIERSPINIAEGEEIVSENNPVQRSDVVREIDCLSNDKIQRGFTKNLTKQWKAKGTKEFSIERSPVNIAESEGVVSENQPTVRTDVVREDDTYDEASIQRGQIKNLTSHWKTKGSEEFKIERSPINICEGQGTVSENEPTCRSDVIREDASYGEENIQRGITKNLTNQWKTEGLKEFKIERSPINVAEGEGNDSENNPIRRMDVVREEDITAEDRIKRGFTKNLTSQWKAKGTEEFRVERSPIKFAEDEGVVAENQPTRRTDVVREYDELGSEGDTVQRGITRNLLSQWKTKGTEEFHIERQPIVIAEGEGQIVENEPVRRSDALREDDNMEDIWLKKGFTKDLAGFWMAPEPPRESKSGQMIEMEQGPGVVAENQPMQLIGVVRENDVTDEVMGQKGQIQNIAGRFKNTEEGPRKRKEQIVIDLAEGPSVLENNPEPVRADVTRCDAYMPDMLEAGVTKNLVQRWKTGEVETASPKASGFEGQLGTSAWIAEIERAPGSGVFENEPEVRKDVIRETDYAPEMIPIKQTRNTRKMWTRREQEEGMDLHGDRPAQLVSFTPPRERSPPAEDFKSYQTITFSSGTDTPTAGGTATTSPPQSQTSWTSSPGDSSHRSSTQLQLLPGSSSGSNNSGVNKAQQARSIKQQQQLLQQKLEQQLLEQQRRYQMQHAALLKRQESMPESQHIRQSQTPPNQPNRQVSLDHEYNGDYNQQQKQFNHSQHEHLQQQQLLQQQQQYMLQQDHKSIMPLMQNHTDQQQQQHPSEHFVESPISTEKTLRSSATLVLNLKQN